MDRAAQINTGEEQPSDFVARRSPRTEVGTQASMRGQNWYSVEVKICDLSQCGFKAECLEPAQIGSYVALDVPGIGPVKAQVRWQIGTRMGGMFLDPISLNRCEWTATKTSPPAEAA